LHTPELHPNPENATLNELKVAMGPAFNRRNQVRLDAIHSLPMGISRGGFTHQPFDI